MSTDLKTLAEAVKAAEGVTAHVARLNLHSACHPDAILKLIRERDDAKRDLDSTLTALQTLARYIDILSHQISTREKVVESLVAALTEARDNGLIYWEPRTERGYTAKMQMIARIDALVGGASSVS